jgi:nicotinamide-nucleotide amidase
LNPDVAIVTRTLKTFGISEGGLDEILSTLFESTNPTLGIYSKEDGIHLRAIATAQSEEQARLLIEPMEHEIRRMVGHAIWGVDDETPVTRAVSALGRTGSTLGILEGFTGGLLASHLTEAPGSDDVLRGSLVATDRDLLREFGVPSQKTASPEVARALAEAARKLFGSDVGIGITDLVTTPTPESGAVGTCHMAFAVGGDVTTSSGSYPTQRLRIRSRAVTQTLLELVRALERE